MSMGVYGVDTILPIEAHAHPKWKALPVPTKKAFNNVTVVGGWFQFVIWVCRGVKSTFITTMEGWDLPGSGLASEREGSTVSYC